MGVILTFWIASSLRMEQLILKFKQPQMGLQTEVKLLLKILAYVLDKYK